MAIPTNFHGNLSIIIGKYRLFIMMPDSYLNDGYILGDANIDYNSREYYRQKEEYVRDNIEEAYQRSVFKIDDNSDYIVIHDGEFYSAMSEKHYFELIFPRVEKIFLPIIKHWINKHFAMYSSEEEMMADVKNQSRMRIDELD